MNKQQALNNFWNSFDVPAYEENTVPEGTVFPYITYQVITGNIEDSVVTTASVWDRSYSWERADLLANRIARRITDMSVIPLDDGGLFITRGTPYSQHMSEESDSAIRRVIMNIGLQFFTND